MGIRFEQPVWLLLILLAAPMALAGLYWFRSMSPARRWSAVVLRIVLLALIASALAGATGVRQTDRIAVVALVDVSPSVRRFVEFGRDEGGRPLPAVSAIRDFLAAATEDRGPDDLLGIVAFDARALAVAAPTTVDVLDRTMDVSMREGTDIERAIRLGNAMFPPDATRRMLLISDGNQTSGDALRAAMEAGGASAAAGLGGSAVGGVPIDVVSLRYLVDEEVLIEAVDAPQQAPPGSVVTVRVVLRSTGEARGTLFLRKGGEPVRIGDDGELGRRIALSEGRHVELINVELTDRRLHRFEAVFEPDRIELRDGAVAYAGDTILENNRGEAFTISPGTGSVLFVDGVGRGDPRAPGATLARTLSESGIDVEIVAPDGVPGDLLSLQAYDLVVLQNVPADALPLRTHSLLVSYVSEIGGGLVMVGGPDSFGAGAWTGTEVEQILPVHLDLPDDVVVPDAAILLVIDNSGSMNRTILGSSRTQQEIANEGAALAVETLDRSDLVGVIVFNHNYTVLTPLAPNERRGETANRIRSIAAGGGTNLPPALREAQRQMRGVDAEIKHVIVLSDGVSQGRERLPDIAGELADEGIVVSSISVGDLADTETLSAIASRGGGEYYRVTDPTTLPRVFFRAVRVIRTPMVREAVFEPVLLPTGSPLAEGLSLPPPLRGLVLTRPRDDPTVVYTMATPGGEPLLAHWNVGLGRVAAFTSDAHRWAEAWLDWPGYRRLWTQIARTISRPAADRTQELTAEIVGDDLRIRFEAFDDDGVPKDLLTVPGTVYGPDGDPQRIRLEQTGPGVYEGSAAAPAGGNYVVTLTPRSPTRRLPPVIGGASRATGAEFRALSSNETLLEQIASITGGRVLSFDDPAAADLFDRTGVPPMEARLPLWRSLLMWALIVLLLDVGTRRIAWDRFLSKEFGASSVREVSEGIRDRSRQAAQTISALRGAGGRGRSGPDQPRVLGTEDARRIVEEQAARRRAARAARATDSSAPDAGPAPQSHPGRTAPDARDARERPAAPRSEQDSAGNGESGLLAAKRRAQQRYRDQQRESEDG